MGYDLNLDSVILTDDGPILIPQDTGEYLIDQNRLDKSDFRANRITCRLPSTITNMASPTMTETPNNKRIASSPLSDEITKKHHGEIFDTEDLLIHWDDGDYQGSNSRDQLADKPESSSPSALEPLLQTPNSIEAKIDKMLELYLSLDTKIQLNNHSSEDKLAKFKVAHNNLVKCVSDQKSDIVERDIRINGLANDINYLKNELAQTKRELVQTRYVVGDLIATTGMLNTRIEYGEKVNLDQWAEIKEKKIILSGVPESKKENVRSLVVDNLKSVLKKSQEKQQMADYKGPKFATSHESFSSAALDSTYRLGKFKKGAPPRNILASFVKTDDRRLILRAKNTIKMGTDVDFYINEDQSVDTRTHRANIKRLSKSSREVGYDSSTSGDRLIVDDKSYNSNELDLVPNRVLRSSAQEKWVTGGLAFRGERSVFSNFFTKPFSVDGYRYISVEQYFQYSKAVYFGESNLARKIIMTSNPNQIQNFGDRAGERVSGEEFEEWLEHSKEILHTGIYAKFSQNPSLKTDLLATGDYLLFEATTNYHYACGINLVSNKWADQSWDGQNLTGRALVEVRDRIRLEEETGSTPEPSCDTSTLSGSASSLNDHSEYKIFKRKSRAHLHTSATCYAMIRSVRPIQASQRRPRLLTESNVTGRSQKRNSCMQDQNISVDETYEEIDMDDDDIGAEAEAETAGNAAGNARIDASTATESGI